MRGQHHLRTFVLVTIYFGASIFLVLTNHVKSSSTQALKSYGESCEADCDERQLLTCSQNTSLCECMHPTSMVYDRGQHKCVGKPEQPCVRYASDFHCVPHASCDRTSKTCLCDKGYFAGENGTACSLQAKYGEACSAKRPCDRSSGMACMEKSSSGNGSGRSKRSCQCMYPSDQFYESSKNACISYAGGNCSFSGPCVRNALCSQDIYELRKGENLHGKAYNYNVTVGRKCACVEGTTQSKERHCLRSYRQPCDPPAGRGDGGCNNEENLKCFDSSVCLCGNPLSQIYERAVGKCVNLVGAKCTPPRRTPRRKEMEGEGGGDDAAQADKSADDSKSEAVVCSSNALCSSQSGVCECKPGYSSTPFSTCLKDYGTECGISRDGESSSSSTSSLCNIYRGLSCHHNSGTCGCIDEDTLKYDGIVKACLSVEAAGPCGTFEYSDSSGFFLGEEGEVVMMTMMPGNHNREVMLARGSGNPAVISGAGSSVNANHSSQSASSILNPGIGAVGNGNHQGREKLFVLDSNLSPVKIHIKCGAELECVNLFGETVIMKNGRGDRKGDNDISQGFCRKVQ